MSSIEHKQLIKTINKLITKEKWQKMPKSSGKVIGKSLTKSGNLRFIIEKGKSQKTIYILKKNMNLFAMAETIQQGDEISATLRRYLGKMYCTKLIVKINEKHS